MIYDTMCIKYYVKMNIWNKEFMQSNIVTLTLVFHCMRQLGTSFSCMEIQLWLREIYREGTHTCTKMEVIKIWRHADREKMFLD